MVETDEVPLGLSALLADEIEDVQECKVVLEVVVACLLAVRQERSGREYKVSAMMLGLVSWVVLVLVEWSDTVAVRERATSKDDLGESVGVLLEERGGLGRLEGRKDQAMERGKGKRWWVECG